MQLRTSVTQGDWARVEELLPILGIPTRDLTVVKFLVREQKYLELLEKGALKLALSVLRQELTSLKVNESKLHQLSGYLLREFL